MGLAVLAFGLGLIGTPIFVVGFFIVFSEKEKKKKFIKCLKCSVCSGCLGLLGIGVLPDDGTGGFFYNIFSVLLLIGIIVEVEITKRIIKEGMPKKVKTPIVKETQPHTAYGVTLQSPQSTVKQSDGLLEPYNPEDEEDNIESKMFFVDTMDGEMFEEYVGEILKASGYQNISTTAVSGDYGVDITASKDFVKYAIQCKRWGGSVGVHAVQEVYSGMEYYKANVAMVITNSTFTPNAKQMAERLGVVLIDRKKLISMIETAKKSKEGSL